MRLSTNCLKGRFGFCDMQGKHAPIVFEKASAGVLVHLVPYDDVIKHYYQNIA